MNILSLPRPQPSAGPVTVAIPAKDEQGLIGRCLLSLAAQEAAPEIRIVLLLNNCTDRSADIVRALAPSLPPLTLLDVRLPPSRASAGWARKMSMDEAERIAGSAGVLLTTDADSVLPPDWIAANLAAIARGADAVAGMVELDPADAARIPSHLHEDDARECAYAALLDEIAALLDPDPGDPWPRHDQHSGASIAVTAEAYRRAGGMPPAKLAEDRMFFDALRRIDARIRHDLGIRVITSGRMDGRAPGGMADTIRRRMQQPDQMLDPRLEAARDHARRFRLRASLRRAWAGSATDTAALAHALRLDGGALRRMLAAPYFGAAWAMVEAASPVLRRTALPVSALAAQTAIARAIRHELRVSAVPAEGPDGIPAHAAAAMA